jgi:hypothetical protein
MKTLSGVHHVRYKSITLLQLELKLSRENVNCFIFDLMVLQAKLLSFINMKNLAYVLIVVGKYQLVTPGFFNAFHPTSYQVSSPGLFIVNSAQSENAAIPPHMLTGIPFLRAISTMCRRIRITAGRSDSCRFTTASLAQPTAS